MQKLITIGKIGLLGALIPLVLAGCNGNTDQGKSAGDILSPKDAEAKALSFINEQLIPADSQKAEISSTTEENGLYKFKVKVGEREVDSYMSKDGVNFFPQAVDMVEFENTNQQAENTPEQQAPVKKVSTKKDTPEVELFVMSHCPYGTQIEKGMLPVLKTLGDKIDFELKFVDYAMHGEKELNEQLAQYCIQKEQNDKLIAYLECFLDSEDSELCLNEAGIDKASLNTCVEVTDEEYQVTAGFKDKSTWKSGSYPTFNVNKESVQEYGIGGSPGLVINGEEIQANRDANSLLATICSGFTEKPEECNQQLSTAAPSPGFGQGESGSNSNASCN